MSFFGIEFIFVSPLFPNAEPEISAAHWQTKSHLLPSSAVATVSEKMKNCFIFMRKVVAFIANIVLFITKLFLKYTPLQVYASTETQTLYRQSLECLFHKKIMPKKNTGEAILESVPQVPQPFHESGTEVEFHRR